MHKELPANRSVFLMQELNHVSRMLSRHLSSVILGTLIIFCIVFFANDIEHPVGQLAVLVAKLYFISDILISTWRHGAILGIRDWLQAHKPAERWEYKNWRLSTNYNRMILHKGRLDSSAVLSLSDWSARYKTGIQQVLEANYEKRREVAALVKGEYIVQALSIQALVIWVLTFMGEIDLSMVWPSIILAIALFLYFVTYATLAASTNKISPKLYKDRAKLKYLELFNGEV